MHSSDDVCRVAAMTEIYEAIKFPLALSGAKTGVHRVLENYKNAALKRRRQQLLASPAYCLSFFSLIGILYMVCAKSGKNV